MGWSKEQNEAIRKIETEDKIVLDACAGSGKTETLRGIYGFLTTKMGYDYSKVLCISFTVDAAKNFKKRLVSNYPGAEKSHIKTMHSLGLELIKAFPGFRGKPIRVLEDSVLIKEAGLDTFPGLSGSDLLKAVHQAREMNLDITDIKAVKKFCNLRDKTSGRVSQFLEGYTKYMEMLGKMHSGTYGDPGTRYIDKPDMILLPVEYMKADPQLRDGIRKLFTAILVDEFQDMNPAQIEFIDQILDKNTKCVVAGDSRQSIFKWRGSLDDAMMRQARKWGVEATHLTTNFRSTKEITQAANSVLNEDDSNMSAVSGRTGEKPRLIGEKSEDAEMKRAVALIKEAMKNGTAPEDILCIARTNRKVELFRKYLQAAGIPVQEKNTDQVVDKCGRLMSWITGDMGALEALLGMFPPDSTEMKVFTELDGMMDPDEREQKLRNMMEEESERGEMLRNLLVKLEEASTPANMKDAIEFAKTLGCFGEKEMEQVADVLREFEVPGERSDFDIMNELLLASKDDSSGTRGGGVRVSTIHKIKGGQAKIVIADVTQGDFPRNGDVPSEEEKHNLYVTMTRAEQMLYLLADLSRGVSCLVTDYVDKDTVDGLDDYSERHYSFFTVPDRGDEPPAGPEDGIIELDDSPAPSPTKEEWRTVEGIFSSNASLSEGSSDGLGAIADRYGLRYDSVTNAFFASTTEDVNERMRISKMSSEEAGRLLKVWIETPEGAAFMKEKGGKTLDRLTKMKFEACDIYAKSLAELGDPFTEDGKDIPGVSKAITKAWINLVGKTEIKDLGKEETKTVAPGKEAVMKKMVASLGLGKIR